MTSEAIRDLMWRSAGLFRRRDDLRAAVDALDSAASSADAPPTTDAWRARNLVTVARLIARAALGREESRGGHYREDFPQRADERWRVHLVEVK